MYFSPKNIENCISFIHLVFGSTSLYSSNFGSAAIGGTVGGCVLFIIGILIAVFVLRYGHVLLHTL